MQAGGDGIGRTCESCHGPSPKSFSFNRTSYVFRCLSSFVSSYSSASVGFG